jgi:hypothetical protein
MSKKTVSISLPKIEGAELKSATVDLKKGVVVAEYEEENLYLTVKRGDFLTCLSDPSKTVIFGEEAWSYGGLKTFTILYDLPMKINGRVAHTLPGVKFPFSNFRYSTEDEKARMIKEMEKWGKRYNPETRRIEDIEKDMSSIKTFKDLEFEPYFMPSDYTLLPFIRNMFSDAKQAVMKFENGYGISVLFGKIFYSNGVDTYEVAILKDGSICYDTYITDDVLGYQNEEEVTEIMRKVQELNK